MKHRGSIILPVLITVAAVAILGITLYLFIKYQSDSNSPTNNQNSRACTVEAKICPDGSAVGRVPPNCEFEACPNANSNSSANTNQTTNANADLVAPANWQVEINDNEQLATKPLEFSNLIYAIKAGKNVSVLKRNIKTGGNSEITSYPEKSEAINSGNYWDGLPPSVALSHSKTLLAYTADDGLYVYDIASTTKTDLIRQTNAAPADGEGSPTWSVADMNGTAGSANGTYSMAAPTWSFDDSHIGFIESLYEGSWDSAVQRSSKSYIPLIYPESELSSKRVPVSSQPVLWSDSSLTAVIPGRNQGYTTPGLFVTTPDNFGQFADIASKLPGQDLSFIEAALSPNGKLLAYTTEKEYGGLRTLAVASIQGLNATVIARDADITTPFFSSDSTMVFYIQRNSEKNQLMAYNMISEELRVAAILPSNYNTWISPQWSPEDYLSLVGLERELGAQAGKQNQLFVLDLSLQTVVYASPVFQQFITYAGFSK